MDDFLFCTKLQLQGMPIQKDAFCNLQENENYWVNVFEKWDKPFLVAFGSDERITMRFKEDFMTRIPNPTEVTLEGVGHFCQEEAGPELAALINNFINENSVD